MSQPVARTYSAGSIIYFDGDVGEEIFVLQKGRIILTSTSLDQSEDIKEEVAKGEFFGVKSALGHYPREETAQVISDALVLVFKSAQFEDLALRNPRIVLQMLKVFSGQLRKVHKKVRELLGEYGQGDTAQELLRTAEYYYKNGRADHAHYGFEAFLKCYPAHVLVSRARSMLQSLQHGAPYPHDAASIEDEVSALGTPGGTAPADQTDYNRMLSTKASDIEPPPLDDFDFPSESGPQPSVLYFEALNAFSAEDFAKAAEGFEAVRALGSFTPGESQYVEKAYHDLVRCYMKLKDMVRAIEVATEFIKKFGRSSLVKKVVLMLADIYDMQGDRNRAMALYQKVTKMEPDDKDTIIAENKLKAMVR